MHVLQNVSSSHNIMLGLWHSRCAAFSHICSIVPVSLHVFYSILCDECDFQTQTLLPIVYSTEKNSTHKPHKHFFPPTFRHLFGCFFGVDLDSFTSFIFYNVVDVGFLFWAKQMTYKVYTIIESVGNIRWNEQNDRSHLLFGNISLWNWIFALLLHSYDAAKVNVKWMYIGFSIISFKSLQNSFSSMQPIDSFNYGLSYSHSIFCVCSVTHAKQTLFDASAVLSGGMRLIPNNVYSTNERTQRICVLFPIENVLTTLSIIKASK